MQVFLSTHTVESNLGSSPRRSRENGRFYHDAPDGARGTVNYESRDRSVNLAHAITCSTVTSCHNISAIGNHKWNSSMLTRSVCSFSRQPSTGPSSYASFQLQIYSTSNRKKVTFVFIYLDLVCKQRKIHVVTIEMS